MNGEGQTLAVVRGPVQLSIGSPRSEPGRRDFLEPAHRKRIPRTFAIGTKEVTVEQFQKCSPDHFWEKSFSPDPDTPAVALRWYQCAEYCNWLSAQEGIPKDQWCYEPNVLRAFDEGCGRRSGT